MGYQTALHLVDVKIKDDSLAAVKKALKTRKGRGFGPLKYFLEQAFLPDDGFLCFKPTGYCHSPYEPDSDDGTVPAVEGKWYEAEQIAEWLKLHSEKDGKLIQHSCEGDGAAWGWEFDGRGRLRELALFGREMEVRAGAALNAGQRFQFVWMKRCRQSIHSALTG